MRADRVWGAVGFASHRQPLMAWALLGWIAAATSAVLTLPQLLKVRAMVSSGEAPVGVSEATMWLVSTNAALWLVWSVGTGNLPAGAPSLIGAPSALATIWALRQRDRGGSARTSGICRESLRYRR